MKAGDSSISICSSSDFGARLAIYAHVQLQTTIKQVERMKLIACFAPHLMVWALSTVVLQSAEAAVHVPCYFAFGDSLFDNGNNNDLPTSAKVNYPPYGIDSPDHEPTGRFSNGRNIVDVIAGHLGFKKPVPPFAWIHEMNEKMILKGLNYASGSAGIRRETGQHLGVRIPLDEQLLNHKKAVSRISSKLGNGSRPYLKRCLYMINIGSNDYLNNYYMPEKYSTSKHYKPEQYARVLIKQYSRQIKTLYGMGARKVALFGAGELGCIPQATNKLKFRSLANPCNVQMNIPSALFNKQIQLLVDKLNCQLSDANFTCINMDAISPTSAIGFTQWSKPCCKVRWDGQCEEGGTTCPNRNHYVFFDNFHPTEAMNKRVGRRAYSASSPIDVHPVDIRTLVRT